jgi:hypothetical protein
MSVTSNFRNKDEALNALESMLSLRRDYINILEKRPGGACKSEVEAVALQGIVSALREANFNIGEFCTYIATIHGHEKTFKPFIDDILKGRKEKDDEDEK